MSDDQWDAPDTLVGIAFPDTFRAQEFLTAASRLASRHDIELRDAVIVTSRDDGKVVVRETRDLQPSTTAISTGVWAGLFGLLLGGPVGWVAGTAAGAGAGAIAAKVIDHGIPDEWVKWFRQAVEPGSTIVALLLGHTNQAVMFDELKRFAGAHLVYANVPEDWHQRIREALGEPSPPPLGPPDPSTRSDRPAPGDARA